MKPVLLVHLKTIEADEELGHPLLEAELVEQRRLLDLLSHHGSAPSPRFDRSSESRGTSPTQSLFQQPRSFLKHFVQGEESCALAIYRVQRGSLYAPPRIHSAHLYAAPQHLGIRF